MTGNLHTLKLSKRKKCLKKKQPAGEIFVSSPFSASNGAPHEGEFITSIANSSCVPAESAHSRPVLYTRTKKQRVFQKTDMQKRSFQNSPESALWFSDEQIMINKVESRQHKSFIVLFHV